MGGSSCNDVRYQTADLYDMTTGIWSRLPDMNVQRACRPGAVVVQRIHGPRIYVFGGLNDTTDVDSCEFLDVDNGQWNLIEHTMNTPRSCACAVLLDNSTVVICGGFTSKNPSITGDCERFDLTSHTFSSFPPMIIPRASHAGVHYSGTIVVMGGHYRSDDQCACEQFDQDMFKWIAFPSLNIPRTDFGAAVVGGMIYVAGDNDCIEVYDGSVWNIVATIACRFFANAVVCDGKVVVLGMNKEGPVVYDPSTRSASLIPSNHVTVRRNMAVVSY